VPTALVPVPNMEVAITLVLATEDMEESETAMDPDMAVVDLALVDVALARFIPFIQFLSQKTIKEDRMMKNQEYRLFFRFTMDFSDLIPTWPFFVAWILKIDESQIGRVSTATRVDCSTRTRLHWL